MYKTMKHVSGYYFGRVEVTDDSENTGDKDALASDNDSNY